MFIFDEPKTTKNEKTNLFSSSQEQKTKETSLFRK